MRNHPNIRQALKDITYHMQHLSNVHKPQDWQGFNVDALMAEYLHYSFSCPLPNLTTEIKQDPKLNFPWCENHFIERLESTGANPGLTYKEWPWYSKSTESLDENGQFNHNYMERFWPNHARPGSASSRFNKKGESLMGIRGYYGDLDDVIELLSNNPDTRQAYLPVWFPEDTGNANPGRKPCTLGYHFIIRGGKLDITYHIRSCDYYRHLVDDIYLAARLAEEIAKVVGCELGKLVMNITSLHMFISDYHLVFKKQHKELL